MCGISGAPTFDKAFDLYLKNLERGCFASGVVGVLKDNDRVICTRQPGMFDRESLRQIIDTKDLYYCLFHSRAPTNTGEKDWSDATTHPFTSNIKGPFVSAEYLVAQNGIITNFKTFPESKDLVVDTSIIPVHLRQSDGDIVKTYSAYEGLLTSWIVNTLTKNIYVVKAGSSLHIDQDSFSSLEFENSKPVEDGTIYKYSLDSLALENKFTYNNPYFI